MAANRPRVVVLDDPSTSASTLGALAEHFDVVRATNVEAALESLTKGDGDAILTSIGDLVPAADRILESLSTGLAVVRADMQVLWHNPAFAQLADGGDKRGKKLYQALDCTDIEGPDFCPVIDCLGGAPQATARLCTAGGKHLELTGQPLKTLGDSESKYVVCMLRDITFQVKDHEKLVAIHRAGLELSHLTPAELAQMSTHERIDLLKANILQYSRKILSFKNLEIRLLDPKTNRLNILLSEGMTEDAYGRDLYASLEGNGVTGLVAYTGTSYLCADVEHDPYYLLGAVDTRSSLTVPIIYRDRVIGVFNVESPQPRHFTESDCEFLEVFAREIAVALNTLDLLQAEKQIGGHASVEAIISEVGLPVDEIVADTIRMFDYLHHPDENKEQAHEAIRRVLLNARAIKSAIQKVGRKFEAQQPDLSPDQSSLLAGKRVLLADADPQIRRSAHHLFARLGCDVDTARDGEEAIRLAKSMHYDVILGDIRLPDMNGYEFFRQIKQECPSTPIVLMTGFGYDAAHSMVKARQEGLRVVLYKPFRLDRLYEAIEDAIDPQRGAVQRSRTPNKPQTKQTIL